MAASSLTGRVIAITGAASGIGRATATLLAREGVLLSLADNNGEALRAVKSHLEAEFPVPKPKPKLKHGTSHPSEPGVDPIFVATVDVRRPEACSTWIQSTVAHFERPIWGAANLAGVVGPSIAQERGAIRNVSAAEAGFILDVNAKGTFNCLRAELPHMCEGMGGRDGGSVVNTASMAGLMGVENNGPYAASKHAVVGLTRTAAKEEGHRAIRVNAIAP